MSLIHDALKKAEKEKQPTAATEETKNRPIVAKSKNSSTNILLILLAVALAFFIYSKWMFHKKNNLNKNLKDMPTLTGTPEEIANLKQKAIQLYQSNQLGDSLNVWQQLSLLLPTEAEIYNNLGMVLKKMGKKNEAQKAYNQALALNKDYPEAINNLAVLYLGDGFKEKAKRLLLKAVELRDDYADPNLNLGIIYEQEGNFGKAHEYYSRFLEMSPNISKDLKQRIDEKLSQMGQQ